MEELKQGMRPIGTIEEVKGDTALVRLSGGQAFQVSIPPELRDRVGTSVDAVLSPTKGVIVDVIERMKDRSLLEYQVEKAPKVFYEDIIGLRKELHSLRQAIEWILDPGTRSRREQIIRDPRMLEEAGQCYSLDLPAQERPTWPRLWPERLVTVDRILAFSR